jgi:hypothetical protein
MRTPRRYGRIVAMLAVIGLTLTLTPGPAGAAKSSGSGLTGIVSGPSGPVAGAVVTAYALPNAIESCPESEDAWRAVKTTSTTAGGRYALALAPGHYRIGVVPPDAAAASFGYRVDSAGSDGSNVTSWVGYADDIVVPAGAARSNIDVRLSSRRSITGTVTEQGTGLPLAGIEVRAVAAEGSQLQRIAPTVSTSASGAFSIVGLPEVVPDPRPSTPMNEASHYGLTYVDPTGWHQLWLWWFSGIVPSPNDTPVVDLLTEPAPVRDVVLAPTARFTGVVRDGRGRPLAGIAVEPFSAFPYPPRYTDAKGRYSVEAGMPDGWVVRFSDPSGRYRTTFTGGYEFASQAIAADPTLVQENTPRTERVSNVTLLEGSQMNGLVVYAAEVPAAGAQVQLWRAGYGWNDWNNTNRGVAVACDGTFSVTGLWPGTHNIGFGAPRQFGPSVTRTESIPAPRGTLALGRITLPSWITSGQVNGPDGPLEGIEIDLSSSEDSRYAHAVTDSNGQFRVFTPYLAFQSMEVRAHDPSGSWPDQTQSVTDNDPWDNQGPFVQFQMAPPVERGIEGYVLDADGNPVAGVTPRLLYQTYVVEGQPSDSSGHYSVSIVYQGGLPAWVVEYQESSQTIGYYSDSEPTHLVADINAASAKFVTDPFTVLETITLPSAG